MMAARFSDKRIGVTVELYEKSVIIDGVSLHPEGSATVFDKSVTGLLLRLRARYRDELRAEMAELLKPEARR